MKSWLFTPTAAFRFYLCKRIMVHWRCQRWRQGEEEKSAKPSDIYEANEAEISSRSMLWMRICQNLSRRRGGGGGMGKKGEKLENPYLLRLVKKLHGIDMSSTLQMYRTLSREGNFAGGCNRFWTLAVMHLDTFRHPSWRGVAPLFLSQAFSHSPRHLNRTRSINPRN